ncbi:MAG: VWA domain-containing protein [Ruminococcus sp.]|jgi:uncharacterized protein YegL|nr:VWA domain-containing protein [Ruminococcus sp.]
MSEFSRRLPVYLLLDISGSMQGEPIEALKTGISALLTELKSDPQALETAFLSVITFNSAARQITPLTELMLFSEPEIKAGGATALGAALTLLAECIDSEVKKSSPTQKGDWKPLVFILTDGAPTDDWESGVKALRRAGASNIIACAAGAVADTKILKEITPNVVMMNSCGAGDLSRFFTWVSASVKVTSKAFDATPGGLELPPPPQGFIIVP